MVHIVVSLAVGTLSVLEAVIALSFFWVNLDGTYCDFHPLLLLYGFGMSEPVALAVCNCVAIVSHD